MKLIVKRILNTFGYDIVRRPYPDSLGRHLSNILKSENVNVVFDVGAHYGEFAKLLREIGYLGVIHSFEPVEESFSILQSCANRDQNWVAHKLALGSRPMRQQIHVTRGSSMSSFLDPNRFAREQFVKDSRVSYDEEVCVERLDAVFFSLVEGIEEPRCYLKLDTQGWDLNVMEGASACLNNIYAMQSELSIRPIYDGMPTYIESIEALGKLGFAVSGIFPVKHDSNGAMIEMDCVLINLPLTNPGATG